MILALDLATNVGACFGVGVSVPNLTSTRLPSTGEDVGAFLVAHEDWFRGLIAEVQPTRVLFEAPVLPRAKFNKFKNRVEGGVSLITSRKLQGLAGMTEVVCTRLGLPCHEVQPAEAKQALAGKGNAKKWEMVAGARLLGLDPKTYIVDGEEASDEADASGVWLHGLISTKPALGEVWAQRLRLARGSLL